MLSTESLNVCIKQDLDASNIDGESCDSYAPTRTSKCQCSLAIHAGKGCLKGLCQLESMRSEVMQITFNCQNSIVFNA